MIAPNIGIVPLALAVSSVHESRSDREAVCFAVRDLELEGGSGEGGLVPEFRDLDKLSRTCVCDFLYS